MADTLGKTTKIIYSQTLIIIINISYFVYPIAITLIFYHISLFVFNLLLIITIITYIMTHPILSIFLLCCYYFMHFYHLVYLHLPHSHYLHFNNHFYLDHYPILNFDFISHWFNYFNRKYFILKAIHFQNYLSCLSCLDAYLIIFISYFIVFLLLYMHFLFYLLLSKTCKKIMNYLIDYSMFIVNRKNDRIYFCSRQLLMTFSIHLWFWEMLELVKNVIIIIMFYYEKKNVLYLC